MYSHNIVWVDYKATIVTHDNNQSRLNVFWGPDPAQLMGPLPPLSLSSLTSPFPFLPHLPFPFLSPSLPSPPLPLEVGPLNPARESGGAL